MSRRDRNRNARLVQPHLSDRHDDDQLQRDVEELREAIGLESRKSTSHNLK